MVVIRNSGAETIIQIVSASRTAKSEGWHILI